MKTWVSFQRLGFSNLRHKPSNARYSFSSVSSIHGVPFSKYINGNRNALRGTASSSAQVLFFSTQSNNTTTNPTPSTSLSSCPYTERWIRMRLLWLATGKANIFDIPINNNTNLSKTNSSVEFNNTSNNSNNNSIHTNSSSPPPTSVTLDDIPTSLYTLPTTLNSSSSIPSSSTPEVSQLLQQIQLIRQRIHSNQRNTKPLRINELNILNALRDANRFIEFNRNLPLSNMIKIMNALWEQEGLYTTSNSTTTNPSISTSTNNLASAIHNTPLPSYNAYSAFDNPPSTSSPLPNRGRRGSRLK